MKAFPQEGQIEYRLIGNNWVVDKDQGMDLRDYFAAKAMQAMMTAGFWNWQEPKEDVIRCYKQADAMMEVRNATK